MFKSPMKRLYILFLIASFGLVCKGQDTVKSNLNKYYPGNQLKSDFVFLRTIVESAHPSLYRHFPKDFIDHYFNSGSQTKKPDSTQYFYLKQLAN